MKIKLVLLTILVLSILINLNFISADSFAVDTFTPTSIQRSVNTTFNFTLNNTGLSNITNVLIILPQGATFYPNTNRTNGSITNLVHIFSSPINAAGQYILNWSNVTTAEGDNILINSTQSRSFYFNASLPIAGAQIFTINVSNGTVTNQTTQTRVVNFSFSGYVKNDSGNYTSGVNVSIYQFIQGTNGPPTQTLEASVLTNANGAFNFSTINGSGSNYLIKMVYRNNSNSSYYNVSDPAMKTGTVLPPFPGNMYYPASSVFDFSLNGSTFYLQPAATLRLNATGNYTGDVRFGYEVIDQKVGFPVESNVKTNVSSVDVIVPSGKNYTVIMMREPSMFSQLGPEVCNGSYFNATACATPPKSNASLGTLNEGDIRQVTINLSITTVYLTGCIGIATGHNTTAINHYNITSIIPRLQPWEGFIPPMKGDMGDINISNTNQTSIANNTVHTECNLTNNANGGFWYNISLLGGTPYMLEFYAKNSSNTNGDSERSGGDLYLAGFQNLTTNTAGSQNYNITLYKLLGSFEWTNITKKDVNTSMMRINIQNESGQAVTTSMHVEVSVKNSNARLGTVHYMIETLTNGTFYLPVLNNTNWAEVSVFANDAPPMTKKLNLSATVENNITLVSIDFGGGGDKGIREMNASGQLVQTNVSSMPIQLRFLRRGTSEVITEMNASDFNPLKALVAGSIDLEIKVIATGVTMKFNNFDMFSAKQPPMFAVMDNDTLASSTSQTWKFGNFVPKDVYDNVTLIIPYPNDQSIVNESYSFNMSIPILYQEDPNTAHQLTAAWNKTRGDTDANLTDDFIDYNNSRYKNYLASGGVLCSDSNTNSVCYIDKTNNQIKMEIPHFSGVVPSVSGTAPAGGAAATITSGGGTASSWAKTYVPTETQFKEGYTQELKNKERIKVKILNEFHYVGIVGITATTTTINVSSVPQQATLTIEDIRRFDVTDDNWYDLSAKLNNITNATKASITVKSVYEQVTEETETQEQKKEGEATGSNEIPPSTNEKDLTWLWILIVIVVVIIVGIIYWMKNRK